MKWFTRKKEIASGRTSECIGVIDALESDINSRGFEVSISLSKVQYQGCGSIFHHWNFILWSIDEDRFIDGGERDHKTKIESYKAAIRYIEKLPAEKRT